MVAERLPVTPPGSGRSQRGRYVTPGFGDGVSGTSGYTVSRHPGLHGQSGRDRRVHGRDTESLDGNPTTVTGTPVGSASTVGSWYVFGTRRSSTIPQTGSGGRLRIGDRDFDPVLRGSEGSGGVRVGYSGCGEGVSCLKIQSPPLDRRRDS